MEQSNKTPATVSDAIAKLDGAFEQYLQSQGTTTAGLQEAINEQKVAEDKATLP